VSGTLGEIARRVRDAFYVFISKTASYQTGLTFAILQYQRTGQQALLAEALAALRFAAAATKGSSGQARMLCLSNLAQALRLEYERTGDEDALREADADGREALALAGRRFLRWYRPMMASNLCVVLRTEFEQSGDAGYLREAVTTGRDAVESARRWHLNRPLCLVNLALAQAELFDEAGDESLLYDAVNALRTAIAAVRLRRGLRAGMRSSLGVVLVTLFESTGDLAALREAVAASRAAVARTPSRHAERAMRLNNLGLALVTLGTRTGSPDLLREAIARFRDAADAAASPVWRAIVDQNLALALWHEYDYTGGLRTLREAVAVGSAAVTALPENHARRAGVLANLSLSVSSLAERTGNVADRCEAADLARAAVDATPSGHSDLPRRQANLGATLLDLYMQTHDQAALDGAVMAADTALAALPTGHTIRPVCLGNLGSALHERFRLDDDIDTLRKAVSAHRDALLTSAADDPDRAMRRHSLGLCLLDWPEQAPGDTALDEARSLLADAAADPGAPVTIRILAGSALARAHTRAGDHQEALAAMEQVVALLSRAAPPALEGADRRHRLATVVGAGAHAAACALAAGQPVRAVELLELARGQLMAETLGSRSELARLQECAPDLQPEFTRLRHELHILDTASTQLLVSESQTGDPYAMERQRSERRQAAAVRWEELLREIRARRGLADFLSPVPVSQLRQQAEPGPVVLLSAYEDRCDALILTADPTRPVRHVPLGCTHTDIFEQATALLHARFDTYLAQAQAELGAAEQKIHRVLAWLWDTITGPVLDELGFVSTPAGGEWPRVWWCPVGMLTELPLHAAGHHDDVTVGAAEPRTVVDRVVSSYTATIRILGYARQRAADTAVDALGTGVASGYDTSSLIVAMPETPGAAPLTAVEDEVRELRMLMPGSVVLAGSDATRDSVLAALPTHPAAHFACHTVMPSPTRHEAGRLIVSGDADRPLTIVAISQLDLPGASFAYLSACDTAAQDMSDEGTPITSAFQLAGYGSVIGTLWQVDDQIAEWVAVGVYTELTAGGARPPATAAAATALHHAIRKLRADRPGNPVLWSGYVHTGI
jgi:tetratricopeptide (TPR) repeat protein